MIISNPVNNDLILLIDHHGEYTGSLAAVTGYEEGKWVRCMIVWDGFSLGSLRNALGLPDEDDAVTAAFRAIYADKLDPLLDDACATPDMATIWEISGEGKRRAFDHLLHALDTVPSGDDDVFDYWPNTMDMLWSFAHDLDTLQSTTEHRQLVTDLATKVHAALIADDPSDDWTEIDLTRWSMP